MHTQRGICGSAGCCESGEREAFDLSAVYSVVGARPKIKFSGKYFPLSLSLLFLELAGIARILRNQVSRIHVGTREQTSTSDRATRYTPTNDASSSVRAARPPINLRFTQKRSSTLSRARARAGGRSEYVAIRKPRYATGICIRRARACRGERRRLFQIQVTSAKASARLLFCPRRL